MNPLLLLSLAAGVSAGLAFWQQQAISSIHAATARLSGQLVQTRTALESEQAALASARAQLKQLEAELKAADQARAALAATKTVPSPTPEQEGWWPEKRPYFYLAKKYLSRVQFEDRPVTADAQSGQEANDPLARGDYKWVSYRAFSDAGLNPHLAVLLGMSDEEVARVNDSYASLVRSAREVEAARVQRVEPPKRDDDDGCMVVARLPALTSDMQPLLERWQRALDQSLGASRTELLCAQAKRYFDSDLDKLGAAPREFLLNGRTLWRRFVGERMHFICPNYNLDMVPFTQDWEYGHLFGSGAPCELR